MRGDVTQTLHYDLSGNLTYNSALGYYLYPTPPTKGCGLQAPHLCPHAVTSVAMLTGNETFRYDDDGNLTLATRTDAHGTKTRSIEWNADSKPTVIEDYDGIATRVRYDAFGKRTYRERDGQATAFFGNLVDRSWPTAGGTVRITKHYYAGPLRVASADASGVSWHTSDQLDSPRLRTNQQSAVLDRQDYQPFGGLLGATGTGSQNSDVGFTGQRTDADNGLIYLNARYYDPQLGRFISADPVLPTAVWSQALNPYSYAENNPVSLTDPSGTQACGAAQETCLAAPEPPQTMHLDPMTIEGRWVAPEDRVCQSCGAPGPSGGGLSQPPLLQATPLEMGDLQRLPDSAIARLFQQADVYIPVASVNEYVVPRPPVPWTTEQWAAHNLAMTKAQFFGAAAALPVKLIGPPPASLSPELLRYGSTALADLEAAAAIAAEAEVNIEAANFAQRTFRETFNKEGKFAGLSISDVVADLGSGARTAKDVPIDVIVRDGNTLILNTRSAQALLRAGIPRSSWSVINRTGDPFFEQLLTDQLTRNSLASTGIPFSSPNWRW